MVRRILLSLVTGLALSISTARGDETPQRMMTEAEAPFWYGLAKLNVGGDRWCNAVLISDTEAITTAHCLYHPLTQHLADPGEIKVVLGQWRSSFIALRGVAARAVLPGYVPGIGSKVNLEQVASDLALLQLDAPVPTKKIRPFDIRDWKAGERVSVTGYGRDRPYIPSLREDCLLTPVAPTVAKLDCTVVPGLSGGAVTGSAPADEMPPLVGLISAIIDDRTGMKTGEALVVRIGPRLELLRNRLFGVPL